MNLIVNHMPVLAGDAQPIEVVERKGLGHPDTICDALAEEFSIALSRFYVEQFGVLLHHNVDKAVLVGGESKPAFGGGEVLVPFEVVLSGRAALEFRGIEVPVEDLAVEACRAWLGTTFHNLDFDGHVRIRCDVRPTPVDLLDLFQRTHSGRPLANDTACGVGHAPLSTLERMVLAVEHRLNAPLTKERWPGIGEDVKVFGLRQGEDFSLTVAAAQVDRYLADMGAYRASLAGVEQTAIEVAETLTGQRVDVMVNAGDDFDREEIFLTVTGTSAEAGFDGAAGRGNRIGGLITPHRASTRESAAGKNPITHAGKLYNLLARQIAQAVVDQVPDVRAAQCHLVSQVGRPLAEPRLVQVAIECGNGATVERQRRPIADLVRNRLEHSGELWRQLLEKAIDVY